MGKAATRIHQDVGVVAPTVPLSKFLGISTASNTSTTLMTDIRILCYTTIIEINHVTSLLCIEQRISQGHYSYLRANEFEIGKSLH